MANMSAARALPLARAGCSRVDVAQQSAHLGRVQQRLQVAGGKAIDGVLRVCNVPPQLNLPPGVCVQILVVPACTRIPLILQQITPMHALHSYWYHASSEMSRKVSPECCLSVCGIFCRSGDPSNYKHAMTETKARNLPSIHESNIYLN